MGGGLLPRPRAADREVNTSLCSTSSPALDSCSTTLPTPSFELFVTNRNGT